MTPPTPNATSVSAGAGPIQAALAKFGEKTAIGSVLRSDEWKEMSLAFRERAFFSAGVENMKALQTMQQELSADLAMARDESGAWRDRSSFIGKVRQMVGNLRAEAGGLRADLGDFNGRVGDSKSLTDLASRARAGLIYDQQIRSANGYARWQNDLDPDILDAFPAQELVRVLPRKTQRDWPTRWREAGGKLAQGRMVALKTDPIWTKLSAFGTPWPPFDYGSGMGVADLDRAEAEDLGLLAPGAEVLPVQGKQFNDDLQASVANLSPMFADALKMIFGQQIEIKGSFAHWAGDELKGVFA